MSVPVTTDTQIDITHYTDEVDRLNHEVADLQQQLRHAQRIAAMGTMTSMVVHEFNNLLTPIINYAQLAQRDPRLAPKAIERAVESGKQAADICNAILDMSRDDRAEPTHANLRELVLDAVTAMARHPQKDGIDLQINIPDNLDVCTRRVELQHVMLNLLINARQAILAARPATRQIVISASQSDDYVFIDVTDTGTGIAEEIREKIFQPFFTTRQSDHDAGNGLGLALCRDIVTAMSGWITLESQPGLGTAFTICLPT